MPQHITCRDCGTILYQGIDLESPAETIQRYNGSCPKCGKKLSFDPEHIRIFPSE